MGKIAGTDWKSGQYQKVRSGLAMRIRIRLTYASIHWAQETVQTFPLQEPDERVFRFWLSLTPREQYRDKRIAVESMTSSD